MTVVWIIGAIALITPIFLELSLRLLLGRSLIYEADAEIGYLLAPNQQTRRLGKRIAINEYSMRSASVAIPRPGDIWRLLLVGDSVANGSWWTDQQATIAARMQRQLAAAGRPVEVLNASANSWCPRNEVAYLRRFGTFGAQTIVLLINTDDLFGTAPTSIQVGVDRNYPARRPPLALLDAYRRYIAKPPAVPGFAEVLAERGDRVGFNLEAIAEIQLLAQQANAQLLLAITPLRRELGDPGPRDYEVKARQRLQAWTAAKHLPYLDFLPLFLQDREPTRFFRDRIHLNDAGNERVATELVQCLGAESTTPRTQDH